MGKTEKLVVGSALVGVILYFVFMPIQRNHLLFKVGLGGWDPALTRSFQSILAEGDERRLKHLCNRFLADAYYPEGEGRSPGGPILRNVQELEDYGKSLGYDKGHANFARLVALYENAPPIPSVPGRRGYPD